MKEEKKQKKRPRGRQPGAVMEKPEDKIKRIHKAGKGPAFVAENGRIYKYKNRPLYNDPDYFAEKAQEYINHLCEKEITGGINYFCSFLGLGHRRAIDRLRDQSDAHAYIIEQVGAFSHGMFENNCISGGGNVRFRLMNGGGYKNEVKVDQTVTQKTIIVTPPSDPDDE